MELAFMIYLEILIIIVVVTLVEVVRTLKKLLVVMEEMSSRIYQINLYLRRHSNMLWEEYTRE